MIVKELEWYVKDCNTCKAKDEPVCAGIYGACWESREVEKNIDVMALAKQDKERKEERQDFEDLQHQQPYGWWRK